MTSAISATSQDSVSHSQNATTPSLHSHPASQASGAVPAQHPARSYATATATPSASAGAFAPTQHAKSAADGQMNGAMAQGGSQPSNNHNSNNNSTNSVNGDHGRKPSVVINASGATGQFPNGGPVQNSSSRPAINFGSMGAESQPNAPFHQQNASLQAARQDPRVTSPAHSPSPIPQPAASGGRPPSISGGPGNGGLAFGSLQADTEMMRGQGNMGPVPIHERRPSGHSMQSENSSQGVNMGRPGFQPSAAGRGRGFPAQPQFMGSPAQNYRAMPGQPPRPGMPGQFSQPPGSPFRQQARASPVPMHAQPHMPPGHMSGQYPNYPQHLYAGQGQVNHPFPSVTLFSAASRPASATSPRHVSTSCDRKDSPLEQCRRSSTEDRSSLLSEADSIFILSESLTDVTSKQIYGMPPFDPNNGYYAPYYGYPQPPQSPRPQYPSPFQGGPGAGMQPPFHPPGTPGMVRSSSQASERPSSSLGHPQTPAQNATPAPSHTPVPGQQQAPGSSAFVKPKKSSAIKITDAQGNAINFNKPSTPSAQPQSQGPVIVSTPNAPTPPPRAPSTQHNRAESKTTKSAEETKNHFAEQVKRQAEENKRKEQEEAKAKQDREQAEAKAASKEQEVAVEAEVQKVAADAEPAAAEAADDTQGAHEAAPAGESAEDEAARKKKEEDEEMERMIAEMEAAEREEEEREKAFKVKKDAEKAANAAKEAEQAKQADDELKRQEREAEAREEARERERNGEKPVDEADEEAKSLFANLKKPTLGPGASASGTDTPDSEGTGADATSEAEPSSAPTGPAASRGAGGQKPKPAHLKLETNKQVERAEPTPGMQSLKSARFLSIQEDAKYPDGFKSPNPALNQAGQRKGRAYDKDFLLQFQSVFKEKPSVDWDQKVKDTLGPSDEPGSARGNARTPSGAMPRQNSRPSASTSNFGGAMGSFGGGPLGPRTLPAGTTSEQRFAASSMGGAPGRPGVPGMVRAPSGLGMGASGAGMSRQNSAMGNMGVPMSPRQPSGRGGRGGSKRDDRVKSRREEADMAAKMPLTAGMSITPLEKSQSGWKPTSIGQPMAAGPDPSGNMAPDLVQRKVKAALNKMTPEKFDKISDQILEIAAQSKNESDGRTLRQVIQLTFEKACDEAHWAGMYAKFCHKMLTSMSPEIRDETIRDKTDQPVVGGALFRKYLLNRCQEEFERGWQANLPDKPEGDSQEAALLSDEYYVAAAAKRKGLGLIQFIGQLYKLRMLTLRIMHECVIRLLNFEGDPDEAAVENLTTLLKAVGATMMEDEKGPALVQSYFQRIEDVVLKNESLPSRPKFMIMDLIDLRKAGWRGKDDSKGPKTIQQIHDEAEAAKAKEDAERQKSQRGGGGRMPAGRGDARNFSGGMPPPQDYNQGTVRMDDLRKLHQRGSQGRPTGSALGPGGGLGPSMLGARGGSRRGAAGLGPGSSGTSRTNTPPVDAKKEEPSTAQNAFSALAGLDASGDQPDDTQSQSEAASPPAARNRSKSPMADEP